MKGMVKQMKRIAIGIIVCLATLQVHAMEWTSNLDITALFQKHSVNGTFVVYDVTAGKLTGHNERRAAQRFIPASTFKIPNTLIGLTVGSVNSVDEVLPYGGKPQPYKTWEKDMSLRDAIVISNVPVYQELARRTGLERMQQNVIKLGYGNQDIGAAVETFWLKGPLKISAIEQVQFLAALAKNQLPVAAEFQQATSEILLIEQDDHHKLYGKTGWQNAPNEGVGWWVGWVQKDDRHYAFALNMQMQQESDAPIRIEIGKAALKALGIL